MINLSELSLERVQQARVELEKYLTPTPLLFSDRLSQDLGCQVFLKLENTQPIGSFKIRGASYKISRLSAKERAHGVIAASAGNHAQGVAWGSRQYGTQALIVMPKTASLMKIQNTRALGAEIELQGESYDEAFQAAQELARKTGRIFVHAYEDADVIAGQGTVALEILEQLPEVDAVLGSIGGGGLMSGVALVCKAMRPSIQVYGCQATGASSMVESLRKGHAVRLNKVETFADGIAVAQASESIQGFLSSRLDGFFALNDEAIAAAVLTLMEKAKIVAEGAAAVVLAAAEQECNQFQGKKLVLIVSGGNIDVNLLSRIIDRGLIRAGRRLRINVLLQDRPGSLAHLAQLVAETGANILQAIHDRNGPSVRIDQTDVELAIETRGPEHCQEVIQVLQQHGFMIDVLGAGVQ